MSFFALARKYRKSINPPYNRKDALTILATLLILIAVPLTVLAIKVSRSPNSKAATASGIELGVDAYTEHIALEPEGLDYVYKYVTGQGWQSYIASYMNAAYSKGLKPVFVYYTSYDNPDNVDFVGWDQLMNTIQTDGRAAWVVAEPDTWGYLRNRTNGCSITAKQYVDRFTSTAPANAHLGFVMSPWNLPYVGAAADAADWKDCWQASGANLKMEDIYVDVLDRDQQWKVAHDPSHPMAEYPWSASKFQLVEAWFQALSTQTGHKISVWQIPMGNTNSSCTGINGFRSNFVETWLTSAKLAALAPYVNRMLFGPGIEDYDQTNAQTWNLPSHRRYDCGLFNEKVMQLSTPSGDTEDPTVSVTSPTSGQTVSGTITVRATAGDNIEVTRVEFYYDSTNLIGTDTTAIDKSYSVSWDTAQVSNGSHSLLAKAYDAAGNIGTSSAVTVTVNNPPVSCTEYNPTVSLSPASQSAVAGTTLGYTVNVTNNDGGGCGSRTFSLTDSPPTGWSASLNPISLTLYPGVLGSATLTVTSTTSASAGNYTVTATATNSSATSYAASASAVYQVTSTKPGDIDTDGDVDIFDLSTLISRWGTSDAAADINDDGTVDIFDLSILLSNWGS